MDWKLTEQALMEVEVWLGLKLTREPAREKYSDLIVYKYEKYNYYSILYVKLSNIHYYSIVD